MSEQNTNVQQSWKNPAQVLKLAGLLFLFLIVLAAIFRDRFINQPSWQVSAAGRAEIEYMPDTAKVNIGVQIDKVYAADVALERLDEKIKQVMDNILALGIEKKDIQTENYSVYPQYDYIDNRSVLSGYSANQQLVVTVHDLSEDKDLVSKVIKASTEAGVNQINGVNFESSNLEELKQEARVKAIADAKNKAAELAAASGVKLDRIVGWWENFIQSPDVYYGYYDGKGGAGGGAAMPSGSYQLVVEMNLNYKIK